MRVRRRTDPTVVPGRWIWRLAVPVRCPGPKLEAKDNTQALSFLSYFGDLTHRGAAHLGLPRSGIFGTHSIALDPLAFAYETTGDEKYIQAGMRSVEGLLDSQEFRTPVHEGKPYAMVYRTFINFLKAASELGYLAEYGCKF